MRGREKISAFLLSIVRSTIPKSHTMKGRDKISAFLGGGTELEGKLTFQGAIRIDGYFKGEISADGTLIVGKGAIIEANICAPDIVISGEIHGNIIADHEVVIHPSGKVFGDIQAPAMVTHQGMTFEGTCLMHQVITPSPSKGEGHARHASKARRAGRVGVEKAS